jgi:hypothetical protein
MGSGVDRRARSFWCDEGLRDHKHVWKLTEPDNLAVPGGEDGDIVLVLALTSCFHDGMNFV